MKKFVQFMWECSNREEDGDGHDMKKSGEKMKDEYDNTYSPSKNKKDYPKQPPFKPIKSKV